jgi:hypothetical protein
MKTNRGRKTGRTAGAAGATGAAAAIVLALVALGAPPARADAPAPAESAPAGPTLIHSPIASAVAGAPLTVTVAAKDADELEEIRLVWRRRGDAAWQTERFTRAATGTATWVAAIPADAVVEGVPLEYYFSSRARGAAPDAPERLHFASPGAPHVVLVPGDEEARLRRDYLARHLGNRSRFAVAGEFVNFGVRPVESVGRILDYYWRIEADYTYRLLGIAYSLRLGGGILRGETYDLAVDDAGNPVRVPVALCTERAGRLCVGLTYGFAEVRFRFGPIVRLDVKATLGAGGSAFEGGLGGTLTIGNDPGTHVAVGVDAVTAIGVRAFLKLAWNTVPRVPMSLTLEATNFPDATDVSGRVSFAAGVRLGRHWLLDANVGYATRDFQLGGVGGGLGLALEL